MIGEFCIVRSREQGVVCGVIRGVAGRAVELADARQIHGWTKGTAPNWSRQINTLFEASLYGLGNARISEPVAAVLLLEACGVIPCTPEAEENLKQSRWNKFYDPTAETPAKPRKAVARA